MHVVVVSDALALVRAARALYVRACAAFALRSDRVRGAHDSAPL